jgi:hypothetical protein
MIGHPQVQAVSLAICAPLAIACNLETSDPKSEDCTPIAGVEDCINATGGDTGSETGYDAGGDTGGGLQELPAGTCQHNYDPGIVGLRYQCEGQLFASISFDAPLGKNCNDILGDRCSEHHVFAPPDDKYESPDVMACCGEYDPLYKDTYLEYCNYDVIQQTCISITKRLEKLVEDGSFGVYGNQGSKLQQWIAANYATCFAEFLINDGDPAPDQLDSYWAIPNNNDWSSLENFVVYIGTGTESVGLHLPVDPNDSLTCQGAIDNNEEVFEGAPAPSGGTIHDVDLSSSITGSLVGPSILGGQVTGSAKFSSSCATQGCSTAEFWMSTRSQLSVEDIALFTDNFSVTNGNGSSGILDSARIVLYDTADTSAVYDAFGTRIGYQVAVGDAFFLISATADNVYDHYLATNSTTIFIEEDLGTWDIASFDIEYIDDNSETWTISIPASTWN